MSRIRRFLTAGMVTSSLVAGIPVVWAEEPALVLTEQQDMDKAECMKTLGISEEQIKFGTFLYRVRVCMNDKVYARATQQANQRRLVREAAVRRRLIGGANVGVSAINSQSGYRYLQQNQDLQTRKIGGSANRIRQAVEVKSRRQLIKELEKPVGVSRKEQSQTYQNFRREAYDACRQHNNTFARNDCIRVKLRELGSQN